MKRELLEPLFTDIHRNFSAVLNTVPTFLALELRDMHEEGLSNQLATETYNQQVKKLKFLVTILSKFTSTCPEEIIDTDLLRLFDVLVLRITDALEIPETINNSLQRKVWANTALRGSTLCHAARNSFREILKFTKANHIAIELESTKIFIKVMILEDKRHGLQFHVPTSGFGGFVPPTDVVSHPKPPKIAVYKCPQKR